MEATLIPVDQWIFNLYRVTYHHHENDMIVRHERHIVSTEIHVAGEILEDEDAWPSEQLREARWQPIRENVGRPRQIGSLHGLRLDEDGWTAGKRLAS